MRVMHVPPSSEGGGVAPAAALLSCSALSLPCAADNAFLSWFRCRVRGAGVGFGVENMQCSLKGLRDQGLHMISGLGLDRVKG